MVANQARFGTPSEFKRSGLGGDDFGATIPHHLLFAIHETTRTESPHEGNQAEIELRDDRCSIDYMISIVQSIIVVIAFLT